MKIMLGVFAMSLLLAMSPARKQRIVFFGDSITEVGVKPGGYIQLLQKMIEQQGLQNRYELMGAGISGNKVYDLYLRYEEDVLAKKPDVVVIWVGVNDVWHKAWGTGTDLDKYEKFYEKLIQKLQAKKIKVILATPAVIGEKHDGSNPFDKDLDAYSNVVRELAGRNNCPLADLRKAFLEYSASHNASNQEAGILTTDKVHLNAQGNELVAGAMWKLLK